MRASARRGGHFLVFLSHSLSLYRGSSTRALRTHKSMCALLAPRPDGQMAASGMHPKLASPISPLCLGLALQPLRPQSSRKPSPHVCECCVLAQQPPHLSAARGRQGSRLISSPQESCAPCIHAHIHPLDGTLCLANLVQAQRLVGGCKGEPRRLRAWQHEG